jgi:hypothetical protein
LKVLAMEKFSSGGIVDGEGAAARRARHGRVEGAVVAIADLHQLPVFTAKGEIGLVTHEHDLFVVSVADEDGHALLWLVRDEIDRSLDGVEIARAVSGHDKLGSHHGRRRSLGGKGPGMVRSEGEAAGSRNKGAGVDCHHVPVAVVQGMAVQVDCGRVAVEENGKKMKVGKAADGVELIVIEVGRRRGDCWCGGGRCRRGAVDALDRRHRQTTGRIGACGDAEVERVDEVVTGCVEDTDMAGVGESDRAAECQNERCIGIDTGRVVSGEAGNRGRLCPCG